MLGFEHVFQVIGTQSPQVNQKTEQAGSHTTPPPPAPGSHEELSTVLRDCKPSETKEVFHGNMKHAF